MEMDQEEDLMAKRRGTPRWARLLSWIVAAVIWLWVINITIVRDRPWSNALANASAEQLNIVIFVAVATVLAASAMFLVRLIGRGLG